MFRLIVTEKVRFPGWLAGEVRELLIQLLVKNPDRRLGGGQGDAEDIMQHAFFATIDWTELQGEADTRYVDPEFLDDCHQLTPPGSAEWRTLVAGEAIAFSEFLLPEPRLPPQQEEPALRQL